MSQMNQFQLVVCGEQLWQAYHHRLSSSTSASTFALSPGEGNRQCSRAEHTASPILRTISRLKSIWADEECNKPENYQFASTVQYLQRRHARLTTCGVRGSLSACPPVDAQFDGKATPCIHHHQPHHPQAVGLDSPPHGREEP